MVFTTATDDSPCLVLLGVAGSCTSRFYMMNLVVTDVLVLTTGNTLSISHLRMRTDDRTKSSLDTDDSLARPRGLLSLRPFRDVSY